MLPTYFVCNKLSSWRPPTCLGIGPSCGLIAGSCFGRIRQCHQSLYQPLPRRTRWTIDLIHCLHYVFSATPVSKVQSYEPSSLDVSANYRFRHSAASESAEE